MLTAASGGPFLEIYYRLLVRMDDDVVRGRFGSVVTAVPCTCGLQIRQQQPAIYCGAGFIGIVITLIMTMFRFLFLP